MGFIGVQPASVPLTADDVPDLPATKITSGTFPALNGSNLTSLPAGNLTGTLPAISGANLTGVSAGKLLQCLQYTMASATVTSSTSYVNFSSMIVTITPSATSSKILLLHSAPSTVYTDNNSNMGNVAIFRDSTNITTLGHNTSFASYQFTDYHTGSGITYLDSPNSTSALEYRVKVKCDNSGLQFIYGSSYSNGSQPRQSSLIAMEIGA